MGESLMEQCRVKEEGPWVVNFFYQGRINDGTSMNKHQQTLCQQLR
jgi:hypothetical protein